MCDRSSDYHLAVDKIESLSDWHQEAIEYAIKTLAKYYNEEERKVGSFENFFVRRSIDRWVPSVDPESRYIKTYNGIPADKVVI